MHPMSAPEDSVPVDDDEYVLRLIHPVYYKASLPLPIQPEAFRPTARDTTGLSVFRLRFATPQDALLVVVEAKRPLYYVSRLSVRDLLRLGLRVTPDPIAVAPGHALMPELNTH